MKTKIIIIAFLLLFNLTSFAQTKEETVAWIKEKLEKYGGTGGSKLTNVNVSECDINYVQKWYGEQYQVSFNPSQAKSWKVSPGKILIDADAKIIRGVSNGQVVTLSTIFIRDEESDIHERMIKALTHLATFCDKKKEAF